jgi:hypothetical protein
MASNTWAVASSPRIKKKPIAPEGDLIEKFPGIKERAPAPRLREVAPRIRTVV